MAESVTAAALDANVLIRYLVGDAPALAIKKDTIVGAVAAGDVLVILDPGILMRDKARYLLALELFAGPVKHFGDACCCAAAITSDGGRLYSFDNALSSVPGIGRSEEPLRD